MAITLIYLLIIFVPGLALAVRRLHDTNRSGWLLLSPLIALIVGAFLYLNWSPPITSFANLPFSIALILVLAIGSAGLLIFWFSSRGTQGLNRFGPDPIGGESTAAIFD